MILGGKVGAFIIVFDLVVAVAFSASKIFRLGRDTRSPGFPLERPWSRFATIIVTIAATLIVILIAVFAHTFALLAPILPGLYPRNAANALIARYFVSLDKMFAAQTDEALVNAYFDYLNTLTEPYMERNLEKHATLAKVALPPGISQAWSIWQQLSFADRASLARTFRALYGLMSSCH